MKIPGRSLEKGNKIASAAVPWTPTTASSIIPGVMISYQTAESLCHENNDKYQIHLHRIFMHISFSYQYE